MTTEALSDWSTPVQFTVAGEIWPSIEYGKITASDGVANDYFGVSCALSSDGTHALIGSVTDSPSTDAGSVYYFTRSGTTWTQVGKITASDPVLSDNFCESVALNSDATIALIGAYMRDDKATNAGAVYYFTRSGTVWTQVGKIFAVDAAQDDQFGQSVALNADGTHALIGAIHDDDKGSDSGSVYYFTRSGNVWTQIAKITASDGAASDSFGFSVALNSAGDAALIGSLYDDDNVSDSGSVYYFTRSGSVWTQVSKIYASDAASSDGFGYGVALNADATIAMVGANGDDDTASGSGSVYVFTRSGTVWTQKQKLHASDAAANDAFGSSVAISSDGAVSLVGAYGSDTKASNAGCAYMFS